MRLAVTSSADVSVLEAIWSGVADVTAKLGSWVLKQMDTFFASFTPTAGAALGNASPFLLIAAVDLWFGGHHISELIAGIAAAKVLKK